MASFFVGNSTPDFLFIRSSGNPIDLKGFEQMITSDIIQEKAEITKIHRLGFLSENIVICIFTLGSEFTYKRKPNDDLPKVTSIFKEVNNVWKIHWMQHSIGDQIYPYGISKLINLLMMVIFLGSACFRLIICSIK